MGGDAVDDVAGREMAGPADVARHADAAVVDRPFPAAQAGVEPHLGGTIVGQEDDDGVAGQPSVVEGLQDLADVGVDVRDHRVDPRDRIGRCRERRRDRLAELGEIARCARFIAL